MRTTSALTAAAIVSAGTIAALAPTIRAEQKPQPAPLIECPPSWVDVGDGYGGYWCEQTWTCPSGTWQDHNGDGSVNYGECMIGTGAASGTTPTWDYSTNPNQPPTTAPPTAAPSVPQTTVPATAPPATPAPGTTPPADPTATDAPAPTAAATDAPAATAAPINPNPTLVPTPADAAEVVDSEPALTITSAEVLCNGLIHVEYETAASPAPAERASHLVVFNPSQNVVDFHVAEFTDQVPNGSFAFEQLGSVEDSYRVFVTVVFDPSTPGSVSLTSWAEAAAAPGC